MFINIFENKKLIYLYPVFRDICEFSDFKEKNIFYSTAK